MMSSTAVMSRCSAQHLPGWECQLVQSGLVSMIRIDAQLAVRSVVLGELVL